MSSTADYNAFDRGVDPVLRIILPAEKARKVVEYEADPGMRERIDELANKSTEGELSEEERFEYEEYARANNFVAILQAQARKVLANVKE